MNPSLAPLHAITDAVLSFRPTAPVKAGNVQTVGKHEIVQGDCVEVMRGMKAGSVDVVITSPPYNIKIKYSKYRDNRPRSEYVAWIESVGKEVARVLAGGGSFFLNVGGTNTDPLLPFELAIALQKQFVMQNHIIWVKSVSIADESYGHFKPINSRRFLNHNHEHIFHFTKAADVKLDRLAVGVPFKDKTNIKRWGHKADRRCAGNVWFIPYKTVQSKDQKHNHPCTFPVELPQRCIRLHGKKGAVVLDPFLGTGTTLVAAEREGCRGIGIDLDAVYCKTAKSRVAQEQRLV